MLLSPNEDDTAVHGCHCVIRLCACVRCWPYRGVGSVCFSAYKIPISASMSSFTVSVFVAPISP